MSTSPPPEPASTPLTPAPLANTKLSATLPPVRFSTPLKLNTLLMLPVLVAVRFHTLVPLAPINVSLPALPTNASMPLNPPAAPPLIAVAEDTCRSTATAAP